MDGALETAAAHDRLTVQQLDIEHRFALLVSTHRERARRLAWRLVGGAAEAAEDITQDAFVKAYQKLSAFRHEARLETWFYRILIRQAHSYRRWRSVRDRWHQLENPPEIEQAAQPGGTNSDRADPFVKRRDRKSVV